MDSLENTSMKYSKLSSTKSPAEPENAIQLLIITRPASHRRTRVE